MFFAIIPILMAVVGSLMFALSANPKLSRIGELIMAAGLFAFAFAYSGQGVRLGAPHSTAAVVSTR